MNMMLSHVDYLSEAGAIRLAVKIREFWRRQGKSVSVWTEVRNNAGIQPYYVVRSTIGDMLAGKT